MLIEGRILSGFFLERPNRFSGLVRVGYSVVRCFVPNPGRLYELLTPGAEVLLRESQGKERKTRYDVIGVRVGGGIVSIDSRVPNKLLFEVLRSRGLAEFSGYRSIVPEYRYGESRFDFLLKDSENCLLEVKSCTLVRGGAAFFPDAPTLRGRRHLLELIKAREEGYRACVFFLIQRDDARVFSPNDETDRKFGDMLRQAAAKGVEVLAYTSRFRGREITLGKKVSCDLSIKD
jgi:sugar fermentation stimulation protein A